MSSADAVERTAQAACTMGIPIHIIEAVRQRTVPRGGFAAAQDDIPFSTDSLLAWLRF